MYKYKCLTKIHLCPEPLEQLPYSHPVMHRVDTTLSLTSGKRLIRNKWTVLPTPSKVIAAVHQLAAACKKYKVIVFSDKDGNITDDVNYDEDTDARGNNTLEITGVDTTEADITGVENELHTTGMDIETHDTTGMGNNNNPDMGNEQISNNQHEDNEQYDERYDNNISLENGLLDDICITINDMNTIHEMHFRQLNVNPDTGEVEDDTCTHTYNLRLRPTTINYCQATPTCNAKPSGHKRRHKKIRRKRK